MYKKVNTGLNFVDREKEVLTYWKEHHIFERSVEANEGKEEFTFYDGPPTANGKPHIGHILTRVIKDIIPRYRTMKGYHVQRKAGWDTHGLPVELEVEKQLGISGKPQIEEFGIEPFIERCKESVWKYKGEWEKMSDRVGYWADMEHPYVTYEDKYIESEWWALKTIAEKGLLYKGHKVVPYCPRCGTALSSHEVAQGYKDVKETSIFVTFLVKGRSDLCFLAWTTTPWTLPSNVALCVNAHESYVFAEKDGMTYICAEALLESALGEGAQIKKTVKGSDLCGMEYEPLFPFAKPDKRAWFIVSDDYVTLDAGSGIVHIAPAFGEDDARVGRENDLPLVQLINPQGCFIEDAAPYAGMFIKDADKVIIKDLKEAGRLYKALEFTHSYPFCWRCDTPLIYYARSTWFIKMTAVKDQLIRNNRSINWIPESIKEGRMGNFLENVIDWGLSRERYWGTPLPVWQCECGHFHTVGSRKELAELTGCPENIELHKPFLDPLTMTCEKCGGVMHRVPEVIDCWFDSGSMPFAQLHYPFENKEAFEKLFPADFISEAIDQTRGWFYTLLAISTLLFDKAPFKNCIVLGHGNDGNGIKRSKHKGNVVDPWSVLDAQGTDAVRWYFYTGSAPWLPSRFYAEAVSEAQRKYMGTLWNTYAFFVMYAEIDQFDPTKYKLEYDKLSVMDKWILSRLQSLIGFVDEGLEQYKITETARALAEFTDELSNWYVRRGRERYWGKETTQDKINAFMTLYTVLVTLVKLTASYTPFIADEMYRNLVCSLDSSAPESVHLCAFPTANRAWIDKELEEDMALVLQAVTLGRACRNDANIKNRQPLSAMYITGAKVLPELFCRELEDEMNVKNVRFTDDSDDFITYTFKPQLRTVGPKYGKLVGAIGKALSLGDGSAMMKELNASGVLTLDLDGTSVSLTADDLLITPANKSGFAAQSDATMTVILDTNLTDALIREGYMRELVSKIQTMRKEIGLEVTDHIRLVVTGDETLQSIVNEYAESIAADTLADSVSCAEPLANAKEWELNDKTCVLSMEKICG
ncbi:MAG: isoleucine--tRNA ligase [Clostridia bacterium]|nr:isoleucine--tRNA ligase [Clostridia bacterium]